MSKRGKKFIFVGSLALIIFFNYLFIASFSNAGTELELQTQLYNTGNKAWGSVPGPTGLADIIQYAISAFLGLLGVIFLVLIIYAGYNWMLARGDEEKVTTAKNTLARAVVGLIIILAAYSITYFVFNSLSQTGGSSQLNGSGKTQP